MRALPQSPKGQTWTDTLHGDSFIAALYEETAARLGLLLDFDRKIFDKYTVTQNKQDSTKVAKVISKKILYNLIAKPYSRENNPCLFKTQAVFGRAHFRAFSKNAYFRAMLIQNSPQF